MNNTRVLLVFLLALIVFACASSSRVVQPRNTARISIRRRNQVRHHGGDRRDEEHRARGTTLRSRLDRGRHFAGRRLVSNYGRQRLLTKPSDILLYDRKEVMDPIPVEMVMTIAKHQKSLRASTGREVDKYFLRSTFKEPSVRANKNRQQKR